MTNSLTPNMPLDSLMAEAGKQGRREVNLFRDHLKKLPEKGWLNQSFCTDWTIKDVAEHQVIQGLAMLEGARAVMGGQTVDIFSPTNLARHQTQIADLNRLELADKLAQTTHELYDLLEQASPEQLAQRSQTRFGNLRMADLGSVRLSELSLHSWDVRVVNDLTAKVSRESLPLLLPGLVQLLPGLVDHNEAKQLEKTSYQFEISGAARGPVSLLIENGQSKATQDYLDHPDATIKLDSEAFLRLSWGRLKNLDWMIRDGWVKVEGDQAAASKLKQLFQGR